MNAGYFQSTGLRIMQAANGDVLFVDSGWKTGVKMSHTIRWEILKKASQDGHEAEIMANHLYKFLGKYYDVRQARLSEAEKAAKSREEKKGQGVSE